MITNLMGFDTIEINLVLVKEMVEKYFEQNGNPEVEIIMPNPFNPEY